MKLHRFWGSLVLLAVLVLPACSAGGEDPAPESEVTTLIYAQISGQGVDREALARFNQEHKDVQIEVRNYSELSENGKSGIDLLMSEIAAGQVPDIIELGSYGQTCQLPYRRLAERGYLEDLWPYIENDPKLGREKVMEAPLKAAEVNGGLYTVFESVRLHTLVGAQSVVGDRISWTMDDLWEAFASMPESAVLIDDHTGLPEVLAYGPDVKTHVLSSFLYVYFDSLVDWETGTCAFDSQELRDALQLVNSLPDEYEWRRGLTSDREIENMLNVRMLEGEAMLNDMGFGKIYHTAYLDFYFGEPVAVVGYPMADGSTGAYFRPQGRLLSMSSTCQDKEAAWEYIRQTLLVKPRDYAPDGIPINAVMYERDEERARTEGANAALMDNQWIDLPAMTKADCNRFRKYFNSVTRCSLFVEPKILDIVTEQAGAYFAGDKTLEQTVELIQNRVQLYVDENR